MPSLPKILTAPIQRAANYFGGAGWFGVGYDAVKHKGNRAQVAATTLSEDLQLRDLARRQLTSTHRDLVRNFEIAAWMVRTHLDYVSTFRFRCKSGDKGFDRDVQQFVNWWARPENFDSAGRHSLHETIRLWEGLRTIDGDCLINKIKTGKVQTIEGDRVQTFGGIPYRDLGIEDPQWVINGVWVNPFYRPLGYMVFRRPPNWVGLEFDRMIPARFATLFGYFTRIDQVRGISPLASAANRLRDIYEGFDYAMVKAKISQFLGVQATRKAADEFGNHQVSEDETDPDRDPDKPRYSLDLGKGPVFMEMDPGDEMKIFESTTPSTQFQGFTQLMVLVALKALDIPLSFFDESHTNFAGSRMAGIRYEASAQAKRHRLWMLLNDITAWRLGLAIADGDLTPPKSLNVDPSRGAWWTWAHAGVPLFDPLKEISADVAEINAGMSSAIKKCRERGTDFEENIDEQAEAIAYAASKGVPLSTALPSSAGDDPNKQQTKTEDANVEQQQQADDKAAMERSRGMWSRV